MKKDKPADSKISDTGKFSNYCLDWLQRDKTLNQETSEECIMARLVKKHKTFVDRSQGRSKHDSSEKKIYMTRKKLFD